MQTPAFGSHASAPPSGGGAQHPMHTSSASSAGGGGGAAAEAEATMRLRAVRHQAKLELRAAQRQLHDRGLYYSAKWCAELLCEIDVDAPSSASTSSLTSAMQSRLASAGPSSHAKSSKHSSAARSQQHHQRHGGMASFSDGMPPPSFEDSNAGAASSSRRQTISTRLAFATPGGAADMNFTPARPAASFAPLPPLTAVSPILATPPTRSPQQQQQQSSAQHGSSRHSNEYMRDVDGSHHHQQHHQSSSRSQAPPTPVVPSLASLEAAASLGPLHLSSALSSSSSSGSDDECDQLLLARSYMDLKEFRRAAYVLKDVPPTPRTMFVRLYALYLAGEKRKEEESLERNKSGAGAGGAGGADGSTGSKGKSESEDGDRSSSSSRVVNRELRDLQSDLSRVLVRDASTLQEDGTPRPDHPLAAFIACGHLWFLYGLVLRELGLRSAARSALLISVATFPWNWSAWQSLATFVQERAQLEQIIAWLHERAADQIAAAEIEHQRLTQEALSSGGTRPPPPPLAPHAAGVFMKDLFYCECLVSLQSNAESESLSVLDQLCAVFPDSMHVRVQSALAYYSRRMFAEAQHLLELAQQLDPYRLDNMDTLSNILFVHGERAKLSALAHEAARTDKYAVQTNCIMGNYYALRGSHARAVTYFQRALSVEPSYLSAWTLLGHEYVELRHTALAIAAYRRALDINPLDYRAWYGLGQVYEILQCSKYALYYFQRAAAIKPYDPRMWCAVGENYEKLALECGAAAGHIAPGVAGAAGAAAGGIQAARLLESALKCYQKASGNNDSDGLALHKLAKLYRRRGQQDLAAEYYRRVLGRHESELGGAIVAVDDDNDAGAAANVSAADANASMSAALASGPNSAAAAAGTSGAALHQDAVDSMLFLAEYYFKQHKQLALAEAYCTRLMDAGGSARDEAKSLLVQIRQWKSHQRSQAAQQQAQVQAPPPSRSAFAAPAHSPPPQATPDSRAGVARSMGPSSSVSSPAGSFFATPSRSPYA